MNHLTDEELSAWKKRLAEYRRTQAYMGLADDALERAIDELIEYRDAEAIAQAHAAEDPSRPVPVVKPASYETAREHLNAAASEYAALVAEGLPPLTRGEVLEPFWLAGCLRDEEEIKVARENVRSWAASLDEPIDYLSDAEFEALVLAVRGDPNWRKR